MSDSLVNVTVEPKELVITLVDSSSTTVELNPNPVEVTINSAVQNTVTVTLGGGRGAVWLPDGSTYDGVALAAILAGNISKTQLANDLAEEIELTSTGLIEAQADLQGAINTLLATGDTLDDTVSRMEIVEDNIILQSSRLDSVESNITTARVDIDDNIIRLTAAETSLTDNSNYIVTQQSILSNEWTVKIFENTDGSMCSAGIGLLVYPAWKVNSVYEIDDYCWFDDSVYKSKIVHTSSESITPANSSYWQLVPYGTKSQFGVLADTFFVQTQKDGDVYTPFVIYEDQVVINGDMIVNGLISANLILASGIATWSLQSQNYVSGSTGYSLNAVTGEVEFNNMSFTINYSDIVDAPDTTTLVQDAIDNTLDTTTGGIIVRDNTLNRYAHFTGGDLTFYDYVDSGWVPYKSVTKTVTGICVDGETVNIGYFREQPNVIVSPYNMQSYSANSPSQSQVFNLGAANLRKVGNNWFFDTIAQLNLLSGVTTQTGGSNTQTLPSTTGSGSFNTTIQAGTTVSVAVIPPNITMPLNTKQVSVSLRLRQQYTFDYIGNNFQVPVAVNIEIQYLSGGGWVTGAMTTLTGVNCLYVTERNASLSFSLSTAIGVIRIVATFICYAGSTAYSTSRGAPVYNTMFAEILQITSQQEATTISASGYASYMAIG